MTGEPFFSCLLPLPIRLACASLRSWPAVLPFCLLLRLLDDSTSALHSSKVRRKQLVNNKQKLNRDYLWKCVVWEFFHWGSRLTLFNWRFFSLSSRSCRFVAAESVPAAPDVDACHIQRHKHSTQCSYIPVNKHLKNHFAREMPNLKPFMIAPYTAPSDSASGATRPLLYPLSPLLVKSQVKMLPPPWGNATPSPSDVLSPPYFSLPLPPAVHGNGGSEVPCRFSFAAFEKGAK